MSTNTADTAAEPIPYIRAVNEALRWALATYPEALIFGEDLALPGGPFGSTRDLHDEFGDRIFDTPISEAGFVGAATGAAIRGRRPIVEIMFMDFTQVAMDQIVNQLANVHYVSNGAMRAPVTIRTQQGHTPGSVAQHSQSLEAIFAHVPGLRVACPATPRDAYEILRTAIASDDPVIVIEARALYAEKAAVPLDGPLEAMGGAVVRRSGADVTIVTWSRMVPETLAAADLLAERGIDAAVIDLRWLNPWTTTPWPPRSARPGGSSWCTKRTSRAGSARRSRPGPRASASGIWTSRFCASVRPMSVSRPHPICSAPWCRMPPRSPTVWKHISVPMPTEPTRVRTA